MSFNSKAGKGILLEKEYQKEEHKQEKIELVSFGHKIIDAIKNGITYPDGRVRRFDVIDFYRNTTFTMDELFYIIRSELSVENQKIYRKFQQFNDKKEPITLDHLHNHILVYNVKFDENNCIIPGSGREVTNEEKDNLYNMMIEWNLPIYKEVYEAALDRWKNDFLDMPTRFNDGEPLTRTK